MNGRGISSGSETAFKGLPSTLTLKITPVTGMFGMPISDWRFRTLTKYLISAGLENWTISTQPGASASKQKGFGARDLMTFANIDLCLRDWMVNLYIGAADQTILPRPYPFSIIAGNFVATPGGSEWIDANLAGSSGSV